MQNPQRIFPFPGEEPVRPPLPPPDSPTPPAPGRVRRALDGLLTELASHADDPGAIEYASWTRYLRRPSA